VYCRDLTNGIPYSFLRYYPSALARYKKSDEEKESLQCGFCGKIGKADVITNPHAPKPYGWRDFCKNKTCYVKFYNYMEDVGPDLSEIPFVIKRKINPLL
jgi:hypothetical protein